MGQSESNLRSVIQTAEVITPGVFWMDEIETGFAGSKNSWRTEADASARMSGSFVSPKARCDSMAMQ